MQEAFARVQEHLRRAEEDKEEDSDDEDEEVPRSGARPTSGADSGPPLSSEDGTGSRQRRVSWVDGLDAGRIGGQPEGRPSSSGMRRGFFANPPAAATGASGRPPAARPRSAEKKAVSFDVGPTPTGRSPAEPPC